MKRAVTCIAQDWDQTDSILVNLHGCGFFVEDVSVLLPNQNGPVDFANEPDTKAPEGSVTGAGGGGAIGLLAGIRTLAIPGAGRFIAAGPLLAALSGAAAAGAQGGIAGALIGIGIPELESEAYASKMKGRNMLISVYAEGAAQVERAELIFKTWGAEDVCSTPDARAPRSQASRWQT